MILAVFGTIYAVCLAILAVTLLKAKPLSSATRSATAEEGAESGARRPERRGRLISTHH
jgi:hypothetical protein